MFGIVFSHFINTQTADCRRLDEDFKFSPFDSADAMHEKRDEWGGDHSLNKLRKMLSTPPQVDVAVIHFRHTERNICIHVYGHLAVLVPRGRKSAGHKTKTLS